MNTEVDLRNSSPFEPAISKMIDALDRYQSVMYPPESNYLDSRETLAEPNCKLVAAFENEKIVGIGAAKIMGNYGELKRFFVLESHRGTGVAEKIVNELESWLLDSGIFICRLETGNSHFAAIRFYEKMGYTRCERFGSYRVDPLSVYMEKRLVNRSRHVGS